MAYLYRHIRLDKNEVFYVGIGKSLERAYSKKNRNKYWNHIVSKSSYEIEILFSDLTYSEAQEKEKEFINLYGRKDLGRGTLVNMTDGGEGTLNIKVSDEARLKISKKHKGNKYNLGRKLKAETKELIGIANKKRVWKDESKNKLSAYFKGRKIWDKKPHPFLGKTLTPEHKKNVRLANPKIYAKGSDNPKSIKINQYTIDNQYINTWGSSKCIERELKIDASSVIKCCKGKLKTCKGYIFKYAN